MGRDWGETPWRLAEKNLFCKLWGGLDYTENSYKLGRKHGGVEVFEKRILCPKIMGVSVLENGKMNREIWWEKEMKRTFAFEQLALKIMPHEFDMTHNTALERLKMGGVSRFCRFFPGRMQIMKVKIQENFILLLEKIPIAKTRRNFSLWSELKWLFKWKTKWSVSVCCC